MVDQASVKDGRSAAMGAGKGNGSPEERLVDGLSECTGDIATLVELQARLAWLDLKEAISHARMAAVLVGLGLVMINAALPVILLGAATVVATVLKISSGAAMLLTGAVVALVAAVVVAVAALRIAPSFSGFRRSSEELRRNIAWIRTVLLYSGRKIPPRTH
jgi:hypothetical protein